MGKYRHIIYDVPDMSMNNNHSLAFFQNCDAPGSERYEIRFIDTHLHRNTWVIQNEYISLWQEAFAWFEIPLAKCIVEFDCYDMINLCKREHFEGHFFSDLKKIEHNLEKEKVTDLLEKTFGFIDDFSTLDRDYIQNHRDNFSKETGYRIWNDEEWGLIFKNKQIIIDFYEAFLWFCLDHMREWDIINIEGY